MWLAKKVMMNQNNSVSTNTTTNVTANSTKVNGTTSSNTTNVTTTTTTNVTSSNATSNVTSNATSNATTNATSSNSPYVNEASLSPAEKSEVNSTVSAVQQDGSLTVTIDSNTNLAANTNVELDLNRILAANSTNQSSGTFATLSGLFLILLTVLFI